MDSKTVNINSEILFVDKCNALILAATVTKPSEKLFGLSEGAIHAMRGLGGGAQWTEATVGQLPM